MAAAVRFLVPAVALGVDGLVDFSRQTPAVAMTYAVLPGAGCAPRIRCVPFLTPLRGR
ncbi:hypothetical protein Ga0061061_103151 [Chelatococcus sambhunathii]|nr:MULTISPECIES: hypothetical protein [Chelatococcus]CUA87087.1 hypothetical protein Ga0061061_103151 [Chelatococcus sambhunathii]